MGSGDVPALRKRIERLARGAGRPFGLMLDLRAGRPANEAELSSLLECLLYSLPDHGMRALAMVFDGPEKAFDHLAEAIADDSNVAEAITLWSQPTKAIDHLHRALGLAEGGA